MVNPIPTHISPERLERLGELADASRLRAALYPSPTPVRRHSRTRQYPSGRPNPWLSARGRRRVVPPASLARATPGADEGAVDQDHFPALVGDLLQGAVPARRLGGEQSDQLVAPAADGGLGHMVAAGHVGQALVVAQYGRHDHRHLPRRQDPPPGPDQLQMAPEQIGEVGDGARGQRQMAWVDKRAGVLGALFGMRHTFSTAAEGKQVVPVPSRFERRYCRSQAGGEPAVGQFRSRPRSTSLISLLRSGSSLAFTLTSTPTTSPTSRAMTSPAACRTAAMMRWWSHGRASSSTPGSRCGISITARPPTCPGIGRAEERSSASCPVIRSRTRLATASSSRSPRPPPAGWPAVFRVHPVPRAALDKIQSSSSSVRPRQTNRLDFTVVQQCVDEGWGPGYLGGPQIVVGAQDPRAVIGPRLDGLKSASDWSYRIPASPILPVRTWRLSKSMAPSISGQ